MLGLALLVAPLVAPLTTPALAQEAPSGPYVVEQIGGAPLPLSANNFTISLSDDEVTAAFPLGFTTRFFGLSTDLFWVGSNGFVTLHFLTPHGCCDGQPLPTAGGPDGIIAGWWTDLDPGAGGTIRADRTTLEGRQALIVDYRDVPVLGANGTASFQVVLLSNGVFEIRIANASAAAARTVSVGAENLDGTVGVEVLRQAGAVVSDLGFRFTPNVQPTPPPVVTSVSPSEGAGGTFARVFGQNFTSGSVVLLDGVQASTFFESSSSLGWFVPFLPAGLRDVTVQNPDGNESTLADAFLVLEPFALHGVFPSDARQGDLVAASGSAFTEDTTLLIGDRPVEVLSRSRTHLSFRIPTTFPPGLHDAQVHDPSHGIRTAPDALLVLGRPDLAVTRLEVDRPAVGVAFAPDVELPSPWRVRVEVENRGDLTATLVNLTVTARAASGLVLADSPAHEDWREAGRLAPGERLAFEAWLGRGDEVGDYRFEALVRTDGVADRDASNDRLDAQESYLVRGVGGGSADPCWRAPRACMHPEQRDHSVETRDQIDTHSDAAFELEARMAAPDFTFSDFPTVFTTFASLPGGGFEECTTWRFLGGDTGRFRVTMDADNGIEGFVDVPVAQARRSNGTQSSTTWSDTRAYGVVLHETEPQQSASSPSTPLERYEHSKDPEASWELVATGVTGDFTHCALRDGEGRGHDDFFFHALPADVDEPTASTSGLGSAKSVVVRFQGERTTETSRPILSG